MRAVTPVPAVYTSSSGHRGLHPPNHLTHDGRRSSDFIYRAASMLLTPNTMHDSGLRIQPPFVVPSSSSNSSTLRLR